jgi:hypothetical protein
MGIGWVTAVTGMTQRTAESCRAELHGSRKKKARVTGLFLLVDETRG